MFPSSPTNMLAFLQHRPPMIFADTTAPYRPQGDPLTHSPFPPDVTTMPAFSPDIALSVLLGAASLPLLEPQFSSFPPYSAAPPPVFQPVQPVKDVDIKPMIGQMPAPSVRTPSIGCQVCKSPGATLHYGGMVCGGCKIFFARAVQKKAYFVCEKDGRCPMVLGRRQKCRSCRFQKCLQAKMCVEEVGKLRDLRVPEALLKTKDEQSVVPYFDSSALQSTLCQNNSMMGQSFLEQLTTTTGVKNIALMYTNLERHLDNESISSSSPLPFRCSLDVSMAEALRNPMIVCERTPIGWTESIVQAQSFSLTAGREKWQPEELMKMQYCRLLLHYLEWLQAIEDLYRLEEKDRLCLVASRLCPVLLLTTAYNTFKHRNDGLLVSNGVSLRSDDPTTEKLSPCLNKLVGMVQERVVSRMRKIELTEEEYVLLKLVCLFTLSEPLANEKAAGLVRSLRCKHECLLTQYVKETSSTSCQEKVLSRVAVLLDIVSILMGLSEVPSALFIQMVSTNQSNMRGELSYDLHVKKHNV